MILADDTTTLTILSTDNGAESEIDESQTITSGGQIRTQTTGERASFSETAMINGTDLRILLNMLKSGSDTYTYFPDTIPVEFDITDFPMNVKIKYNGKTQQMSANGETTFFIDLTIISVDYV